MAILCFGVSVCAWVVPNARHTRMKRIPDKRLVFLFSNI
jgi:hypothetical protein